MSVIVENLSKLYGAQKAVDEISFSVSSGEILGFLGPNGAGKTTTMKMITGFLRQDNGTISVNAHDTREDPLAVKWEIGYLSEHNPLYTDLYVREYLAFVAQLYSVRQIRKRVEEVIHLTGLATEAHKKIGALSKGFRQRVGLAQALIHDPPVLILDEPTSGLDPNQLAEIRSLIRTLGETKTIIFSTHIMQEVQSVCDRVIILNNGRIVIDKPIDFLSEIATGGQVLELQLDRRILLNTLLAVPGIASASEPKHCHYRIQGEPGVDIRPAIFKYATEKGATILEMHAEKSSVEDIFRQLTKHESGS